MPVIPRFNLNLSWSDLDFALGRFISREIGAVPRWEKNFADFLGVNSAFFVPSARGGLRLLLSLINPEKKRALVSAFNHPAIPDAVKAAGLSPVFCDIGLDDYSLDPQALTPELLSQVGVIILPHLYGCPAKIAAIRKIAQEHGVILLEDCAQSCGAFYGEQKTGSFGEASVFSFALTKNFTTLGGGMIAVQDPELGEKIKSKLENLPVTPNAELFGKWIMALGMKIAAAPGFFNLTLYPGLRLGYDMQNRDLLHPLFAEKSGEVGEIIRRPAEMQAQLALKNLAHLDEKNQRRSKLGEELLQLLSGIEGVTLPQILPPARHIFLSCVVRVQNPGEIARKLLQQGIDTAPGYLGCMAPDKENYPCALSLEKEQLHLPIYNQLTSRDLKRIAQALAQAVKAG